MFSWSDYRLTTSQVVLSCFLELQRKICPVPSCVRDSIQVLPDQWRMQTLSEVSWWYCTNRKCYTFPFLLTAYAAWDERSITDRTERGFSNDLPSHRKQCIIIMYLLLRDPFPCHRDHGSLTDPPSLSHGVNACCACAWNSCVRQIGRHLCLSCGFMRNKKE